jgi:hypothetical protein
MSDAHVSSSSPARLYRYRPVNEYSLKEIAYNTAFLCPLDRLNDHLEGIVDFGDSDPEKLRTALVDRAFQDSEIEIALLLHFLPDAMIRELESDAKKIGAPYVDARKKWGVICFTERLNNLRMWERYADEYRGVVIEYDLSRMKVPPRALWKVVYQDQRGATDVASVLSSKIEGGFSEILAIKKPEWAYEEEWRLLADKQELVELSISISRVITGPDMRNDQKNLVVNALVQNVWRPRFAQLMPGAGSSFELHDMIAGSETIELV